MYWIRAWMTVGQTWCFYWERSPTRLSPQFSRNCWTLFSRYEDFWYTLRFDCVWAWKFFMTGKGPQIPQIKNDQTWSKYNPATDEALLGKQPDWQADQHHEPKFLEPGNVTGSVCWMNGTTARSLRHEAGSRSRPDLTLPPALTPSWAEGCRVLCSFPNLLCKQKAEPAQWGTTAVWKGSKSMQSSWDRALWVKAILRQFKYCVIVGRFFHARVTPWLSKTTFDMVFGKDCFWPLLKFWMAPLVSLTMLEHFDLVCIAVSKAKTGQWAISAAGNLLRTLSWPSHLHRWNHLDVLVSNLSIRWWIVSKQVAQPPLLRQGLICKGTTPRRTWYTKISRINLGPWGQHLWILGFSVYLSGMLVVGQDNFSIFRAWMGFATSKLQSLCRSNHTWACLCLHWHIPPP